MNRKCPGRPKVVVTNGEVPEIALQLLREKCEVVVCDELPLPTRADILRRLPGATAAFWITREHLNVEALDVAGKTLRIVSTMSAGYDNVDVAAAKKRGILLGHTPGVLSNAVAEVAVLLTLATARRLHAGRRAIERNEWNPGRPGWLLGLGLTGATVGVLGLGGVGQAVGRMLRGLGATRLLYHAPRPKPAAAESIGAEHVPFKDLLQNSDVVVACCPLNDETRGIMGEEAFSLMKSTSVFVNVSRGEVVNQGALVAALRNGQILGAGLDVMTPEPLPSNHELLTLDNCVITPHIGSATVFTRNEMALLAARNILAALDGKPMLASIPGSLD